MLVLCRRIGEELVIDGDIRIKVIDIRPGRVRLGVTAPPYVSIYRNELCDDRKGQLSENPVATPAIG